MTEQGTRLLAAIRSHGSDAKDIRDAAHEATHAKQTRLLGKWTRDRIHDAVELLAERSSQSTMLALVRFEIEARAVEMIVCEHVREPYDVDQWALVCWQETAAAYRVGLGDVDLIVETIRTCARSMFTRMLADSVMRVRLLGRRITVTP